MMLRGSPPETAAHQIRVERAAAVNVFPYQCELCKGKSMSVLAQWVLSGEAEHDSANIAVSQTLQMLFAEIPTLPKSHGLYIEEFECKSESEWNKWYSNI